MGYRAFLFDMDNTLLQSRIDYRAMRLEVGAYLARGGWIDEDDIPLGTTASLINAAVGRGLAGAALAEVWSICARHETAGMAGAGLEPGAMEMLRRLRGEGALLAVLTNNAQAAADKALRETGILPLFDVVAGREAVPAIKPSPASARAVIGRYPDIPASDWLAVGDAWIDGAAAAGAGVAFAAYRADRTALAARGVTPVAWIGHWAELPDLLREMSQKDDE